MKILLACLPLVVLIVYTFWRERRVEHMVRELIQLRMLIALQAKQQRDAHRRTIAEIDSLLESLRTGKPYCRLEYGAEQVTTALSESSTASKLAANPKGGIE